MRFSILHISDLHRDLRNELDNGPLLQSLLRDVQRYEDQTPPIIRPSICLVSGDLIYGVRATERDFEAELDRQYTQAVDFLISLANALFDGFATTTLITKKRIFVPVPAELTDEFRVESGSREFLVRFDLLSSELDLPHG
jgi:hypothetical protein